MPKIIENVRETLIAEAKRQIEDCGYDKVTIRSVAAGAGIGVGTFYNYFKSKEMLIATFLLEDWRVRIDKLNEMSEGDCEPIGIVREIHGELIGFISQNISIFTSSNATKLFNQVSGDYHKVLRAQLAAPIKNACEQAKIENSKFLSLFVAESVLTWTVEKRSFDEIEQIINKLFI